MYCKRCGTRNDDDAGKCVECGNALSQCSSATAYVAVPNHLVWAIIVTIFCFLPLGVVAIVYAVQVDRNVLARNYAGAVHASNRARTWCWAAFAFGVVEYIAVVTLLPLGFVMGL